MLFSRIFTFAAAAAAATTVDAISARSAPPARAVDTIKVLYNHCYGGFRFSDFFCAEYDKIYGAGAAQKFMATELYDPAIKSPEHHVNGAISSRYDSKIIELYERLGGSYACSGEYANLRTLELPRVLAPYIQIEETDGVETLKIHLTRLYRELLDEVIARRSVRFVDILAHDEIRGWERYLADQNIEFF